MDYGHRNRTRWPNHTLLTYTLPADGQGEGERGRQPAAIENNGRAGLTLHIYMCDIMCGG